MKIIIILAFYVITALALIAYMMEQKHENAGNAAEIIRLKERTAALAAEIQAIKAELEKRQGDADAAAV